ncbi:hypothetical protein EZJ44_08080, partial [Arcanobacterium bovis]
MKIAIQTGYLSGIHETMNDQSINSAQNVFTRRELFNLGITTKTELKKLLANGGLTRIRRNSYATPIAHSSEVEAAQLGVHLGCLSGCALRGLWTPPPAQTHLILEKHQAIPVSKTKQEHRHLVFHRMQEHYPTTVLPIDICLLQVAKFHDTETALIVFESAIDQGLISFTEAKHLITLLPAYKAKPMKYLDTAQSGSETRLRLFFQRKRVKVRAQHMINGVGRVDLLVGKSLIVEADSHTFHTKYENYTSDRIRDLQATKLGFRVIRLSYA